MEIEALEEVLAEYNHAKKLKRLNEELMEHLNSTVRWILHYCEKNDLRPPNLDILDNAVERSQDYIQKMATITTKYNQDDQPQNGQNQ